jgi:hypothetical protein
LSIAQHLISEVHLSGNYIGTTHPPSVTMPDTNCALNADQVPDQVPFNDEAELEDDYALDEVSSDVEMNPADLVDLPSDEDEDEGCVPQCFTWLLQ